MDVACQDHTLNGDIEVDLWNPGFFTVQIKKLLSTLFQFLPQPFLTGPAHLTLPTRGKLYFKTKLEQKGNFELVLQDNFNSSSMQSAIFLVCAFGALSPGNGIFMPIFSSTNIIKIPPWCFCLLKRVLEICRLNTECLITSNLPVLSTPGLPATSPRPGHSREHNTADPG